LPCFSIEKKKVEAEIMKVEVSFLAALLLIGTDLLARAAVQGVEQALVATAIEYGLSGMRKGLRQLPDFLKFGW
jgi:hypothetical protein